MKLNILKRKEGMIIIKLFLVFLNIQLPKLIGLRINNIQNMILHFHEALLECHNLILKHTSLMFIHLIIQCLLGSIKLIPQS